MTEYRFYFDYNGLEGYVSCHAYGILAAEAIFNLMGLHDGLGSIV